jgi:hypothetical protein
LPQFADSAVGASGVHAAAVADGAPDPEAVADGAPDPEAVAVPEALGEESLDVADGEEESAGADVSGPPLDGADVGVELFPHAPTTSAVANNPISRGLMRTKCVPQ